MECDGSGRFHLKRSDGMELKKKNGRGRGGEERKRKEKWDRKKNIKEQR
jgi:hypothetical protein